MGIVIVGLSHKTAPVAVRERLAFSRETIVLALTRLKQQKGVIEGLILSTCNRVELVAHTSNDQEGVARLKQFLYDFHALAPPALDPFLYDYQAAAAVRHIFRVACSLDSMVVGEPQILGQVKEAYGLAAEAGCLGGALGSLMHRAFNIAKRVRTETGIADSAVSVSYAAVELAKKIFDSLRDKAVLIVGAGKMSELAARHLRRSGARKVLVTNRTFERAVELAAAFQGESIAFELLPQALAQADIVITSTHSSQYIIRKTDAQRALSVRHNRPMFFIDIAVPRNVDPEISKLDNVFAYDLDDLQAVVDANLKERAHEAQVAERLVDAEVAAFRDRLSEDNVGPIITALKRRVESICNAELERHLRKAGIANPEERQGLEMMVSRIANKVVHPLIVHLRKQGQPVAHREDYIETLRRVFELHDKGGPKP